MSIRILIVDDTKFLRMMLTDLLTRFGYEVVGQAENGLVALEKFKELKPDIVIMDITMPEMDGIEALKEILVIDPKAIILICSAMSQRGLISKALKAGAINYVMKPFEPEIVNDAILQVLPMVEQRRLDEQKELDAQKELEAQKEQQEQQEQQEQHVKEQNKEEVITIEEPLIVEAPVVEPSVIAAELVVEADPVVEEALVVAEEPVIEEALVVADEIAVEEDIDADPMIEQEAGDIEKVELEQEKSDQTSEEEEFGSLIRDFGEVKDHFELPNEMTFEDIVEIEAQNNEEVKDQRQVLLEIEGILAEMEKTVAMEVGNKVEEEEQLEEEVEPVGEPETEEVIDVVEECDEMDPTDEKVERVSQSSYHNDLLENFISSISRESVLAQLAAAQQAEQAKVSNSIAQAEDPEQKFELKRKKMKNFTSSIMCQWSEEVDDKEVNYFLGYNEYERSIRIDMISEDDKRESVQLSLDGFSFISEWLQQKGAKIDL